MAAHPRLVLADRTMVSADYRMFGLHDPTCEEIRNFGTAIPLASASTVGWAANAVMVEVVSDLVRLPVEVEVFDGAVPLDESAELARDGELALPGGQVSLPHSVDDRFLRGIELPPGPGTYRAQVCGYGRARAREIWDRAAAAGPEAVSTAADELRGVEHYRIRLWQIADEPRWSDEDDE